MRKKLYRAAVVKVLAFALMMGTLCGVYVHASNTVFGASDAGSLEYLNMEESYLENWKIISLLYDPLWDMEQGRYEQVGRDFDGSYYIETDDGEIFSSGVDYIDPSELPDIAALYLSYDGVELQGYSSYPYLALEDHGFKRFQLYLTQEDMAEYIALWEDGHDTARALMLDLCIAIAVFFPLLIFLCVVTGRRPSDDELHGMLIDRMPSEPALLLGIAASGGGALLAAMSLSLAIKYANRDLFQLLGVLALLFVCGFGVELLLSVLRNVKRRAFLSQCVTLKLIRLLLRLCKRLALLLRRFAVFAFGLLRKALRYLLALLRRVFAAICSLASRLRSALRKLGGAILRDDIRRNLILVVLVYTAALAGICLLFFAAADDSFGFAFSIAIIAALLIVYALKFALRRVSSLEKVKEGIRRLRGGELDYKILDMPAGALAAMAEDVNSLGDGMKEAVRREVSSERMRSELVTNVSHDLKTPLTSIINYSDLLCREHLSPEEANDYAKIIHEKGLRLKRLTSDLFDVTRLQSGVEQMKSEELDLCTLVRQALAEHEGELEKAGLASKLALPSDGIPILGDGHKLSRALENLIVNCVKYSLSGTRVHIRAETSGDRARLTMMNIANYEMDFDTDEITERFVRADASRSTEGSGLGLAIARGYVEACGGSFAIETDGDLFKVRIEFPLRAQ